MRIAIIGGAGFVGSHLIGSLTEAGFDTKDIVVVDNFFTGKMSNIRDVVEDGMVKLYREDATQPLILRSIIENESIDTVVNLAMKCLPTSWLDPEGAYMIGVQIAHNLAYLLRWDVFRQLIHFSSSEAYGTAVHVPMDERHPTNPTVPYSAGKLAADILLMSYFKTFNLNIGIVRPFNLIGPRQNWNLYAAVVPLTIKRILDGKEKPFITGDGLQTRDFTYVRDVTDSVSSILLSNEKLGRLMGRVVNFGQGKENTIRDVVFTICEEMGYPAENVMFALERAGDVRRHYADISLAHNLFGYSPLTPFKQAIHKTVEWYKKCDLAAQ